MQFPLILKQYKHIPKTKKNKINYFAKVDTKDIMYKKIYKNKHVNSLTESLNHNLIKFFEDLLDEDI